MFGMGIPELAIIMGIFILIFGPKKLPEIGKSLGSTIKNFRWSMRQITEDEEDTHDRSKDSSKDSKEEIGTDD